MKKFFTLATLLICLALMTSTVWAESAITRIKDIAKVQGVRSNQLMGYGFGFIEAWWKRCVRKQDEFTAFEKNFYS